ncbi:MAG: hypothetical protein K8U57_35420 [Planctomycetes bacterium]|nr:hypothetical protein [Planctomycetota bacterium]
MTEETIMFEDFELIHSYSRAQALSDGTLVDVTATAKEAGIKHPTAVTHAVYEQFIRVPERVEGQDERGRTWDIIWMLKFAIARAPEGDFLIYTVFVRNANTQPQPVKLKAICHPGDEGEAVVTVMLPDED